MRQKIDKSIENLNKNIQQIDQTDLLPSTTEHTFFSRAYGIVSRIDHMLSHKISLNEFKRIDIIQSKFFAKNRIKLQITNTWTFRKFTNM